MSATEDDIRNFQEFALNRIGHDKADLELEDLLEEWRTQHRNSQQQHEDLAAIKQAVAAWDDGDVGRPADEVVADIRSKHGL